MGVHHLLIFKQHMTLYRERKYELGFREKLVNLCRILNTQIDAKFNTPTAKNKFNITVKMRHNEVPLYL